MQSATARPVLSRLFGASLLVFSLLTGSAALAAAGDNAPNVDDAVATLKTKLSLSDQQASELKSALTDFTQQLQALVTKRESAADDEPPDEFIEGVKHAQTEYQGKLKTILSSSQLQSYNELREKVIMEAMTDIAQIRLYDLQPKVHFSDDQLQKLTPVLADSMRGFVKIAWQYAGKRLRLMQKLRVARDLKEIQSKAEQKVQKILTPEEYTTWQAVKKQAQQ
jgi:hypothetical protein